MSTAVEMAIPQSSFATDLPDASSLGEDYRVEAFDSIEDAAQHWQAWEDLARHAAEPNPFYEPWMIIPAWRAFGHEAPGTKFVFIWLQTSNSPPSARLVGFIPLTPFRRFGGLPIKFHRTWQHQFCYLCVPLLHRDVQHRVLASLLNWMAVERMGLLKLRHIPADGPFGQTLFDVTRDRDASSFLVERYERALLHRADSFDEYIATSISRHHAHETRRKHRRLAELGRIEMRMLARPEVSADADASDLDTWLRVFLEVEQLGWKGREESALASNPVTRDFFETICRQAHARGRLMMLGMFLDGRPLAVKCNFLCGEGSYAFKIAYDEAYAKYSPGVLLELENLRLVHESRSLRWMDSCAAPDHPMLNRIWSGRRPIQKILVSPGGWSSNKAVDGISTLASLRRLLKFNV